MPHTASAPGPDPTAPPDPTRLPRCTRAPATVHKAVELPPADPAHSRRCPPSLTISVRLHGTAINQPRPPNPAGQTLQSPTSRELAHLPLPYPEHLGGL